MEGRTDANPSPLSSREIRCSGGGVFYLSNRRADTFHKLASCSDASGEVIAVGEQVTRFEKGDRVTTHFIQDWEKGPFEQDYLGETYLATSLGIPGPGTLTEYISLSERALVRTPAYLSDDEASTLPIAALTAWQALTLMPLKRDQSLLVQGTCGVSIFALQFAKLFGARVIVLSSSDDKLARAKKLSADAPTHYRNNPVWGQEVGELCVGGVAAYGGGLGGTGTHLR